MNGIFVNCPYDKEYEPLLYVMIYIIVRFNHDPIFAFCDADSGKARLDKIVDMISQTTIGFHDLSRCECEKEGEHYRLNMPFELGIDYGYKAYKNEDNAIVILESSKYRYLKSISDLSGVNILAHQNEPLELVKVLREWFIKRYKLKSVSAPVSIYDDYIIDFHGWLFDKLTKLGFTEKTYFQDVSAFEFIDYVKEYFQKHPNEVMKCES